MANGKGPVDDIDRAVKRAVCQPVLKSKTLVFDAQQFCDTAKLARASKLAICICNFNEQPRYS